MFLYICSTGKPFDRLVNLSLLVLLSSEINAVVIPMQCLVVSVECHVVLCLQEIEFMQNTLNQLKMVQSKFVESQECLSKVTKANVGKDMLVPLTSSVSLLRCIGLVVH